ncbi:MAG TPA: hypothetical protein VH196_09580, partial [Terriglobales bacterium]|nr:hypothetical protein [Terriglobales bacterium]
MKSIHALQCIPPSLLCAVLLLAGCRHDVPTVEAEQSKVDLKVETVHTQSTAGTLEIPGRVE